MKKFTREDFQFEPKLKYYFYKDKDWPIEIAIEPCFNGFDVALYRTDEGPWLLREKECTNEEGYGGNFVILEIHAGPLPRRLETWRHALKIANKFYASFMNYVKLHKMRLIEGIEGEEDLVFPRKIID